MIDPVDRLLALDAEVTRLSNDAHELARRKNAAMAERLAVRAALTAAQACEYEARRPTNSPPAVAPGAPVDGPARAMRAGRAASQ